MVTLDFSHFFVAVICKERLLQVNEIMQYSQNYKCYSIDQHHCRKDIYSCTKLMKKNDLKTACITFKGDSVLVFIQFKFL